MMLALIVGLVLAFASLPLLLSLANKPLLGSGLILALFVWESAFGMLPGVDFGVTVYPQDLAFSYLLLAATFRLLSLGRMSRVQLLWLLFGVIGIVSFGRGVNAYGPKSAGVEFRSFYYFVAGSLYLITFSFSQERQRRLLRQIQVAASLLVALAVFRWTVDVIGVSMSHSWLPPEETNSFRVLRAFHAFFLASVFIIGVDRQLRMRTDWTWKFTTAITLLAVLLLQHRSVWAATIVGLLGTYLLSKGSRARLTVVVASAAAVGTLLAVVVLGSALEKVSASIDQSASSAVSTREGTFVWRIEGWQALLETRGNSTVDHVLGRPFGAGYLRYIRGARIEVSPHNVYVQTLLRMGLLGLVLFVSVYGMLIGRSVRRRRELSRDFASPGVLGTLLMMALTYYVAYGLTYEQSVLFALAATGLGRHNTALFSRDYGGLRRPVRQPSLPLSTYAKAAAQP
jgi:hypothetical protein